jgi:hypothetical protein
MQAQDIELHLADLGQELYSMGVSSPVRILMVGGAFMLTQMHSTRMTNDVDVLLKDIDDPTTSPLYRVFKTAVRAVASRRQIPSTWMNDLIGDFLRDLGTVPNGVLWRTYAVLEVYVPEAEYILALKLLAGRQKDREDIRLLCQQIHIQTRNQAQQLVDRYIPKKAQQVNDLDDTLSDLFP